MRERTLTFACYCIMLCSCFTYPSTLKMEAICSSAAVAGTDLTLYPSYSELPQCLWYPGSYSEYTVQIQTEIIFVLRHLKRFYCYSAGCEPVSDVESIKYAKRVIDSSQSTLLPKDGVVNIPLDDNSLCNKRSRLEDHRRLSWLGIVVDSLSNPREILGWYLNWTTKACFQFLVYQSPFYSVLCGQRRKVERKTLYIMRRL
jgi:hypothetical protein